MNDNDRFIARCLFKNKVYESDGQTYENLFVKIMTLENPNFQSVPAYGNIGDRKNDGFDSDTGTYYQVYAPKVLSERITEAVNKIFEDFKGLYNYWNNLFEVKHYKFVLNDKYESGVEPRLNKAISELQQKYPEISFGILYNHHLEDIVINFSLDKIYIILGHIPNPDDFEEFDAEIMNKVIKSKSFIEESINVTKIPQNPDLISKIKFNGISEYTARLLKVGSYQSAELSKYFHYEPVIKENLRVKFNELYLKGKMIYGDSPNEIFYFILNEASPDNEKETMDAVLVLMAYYFEVCDIFEEPVEPKLQNLFEL